jgi:MoaA/NifB/PqqE/SkfB family radical SAM enzyme
LAEHSNSLFKNDAGEPYRADTASFTEVRNNSLLKEIRQTMLKGEWHSSCSKCRKEESSGLKSRRLIYWEKESSTCTVERMLEKTAADGSINSEDFPLETFDIRLGNLCNLKCRMCEPVYSTKWYSDYQKLTGQDHFYSGPDKIHFGSEDLRKFEWFKEPTFWSELFKNGRHIQHIYMIGGEPLLITRQTEFLEKLVEWGFAASIEVEYNTNLTYLPENLLSLWRHFKKVTLGVSLESVGSENNYIRNPSDFGTIVENLRRVDELSSPQFRIWIATTFQVFNAYSLPKMIDWVLEQKFKFIEDFPNTPILHLHPLHSPHCYSLHSLPGPLKEKVATLLNSKSEELMSLAESTGRASYRITAKKLLGIVEYMRLEDKSDQLKIFWQHTQQLDALRTESFFETFPELAQDLIQFKL